MTFLAVYATGHLGFTATQARLVLTAYGAGGLASGPAQRARLARQVPERVPMTG